MKQYTLVVADSSEDFCRALQLQFDPFCRVFCCGTGREVLALVQQNHPDVLVLDLMLPELDGLSLLKLLEATGDCPEILTVTAYISPYILQAAEALGVSGMLEKPCDQRRAGEMVRALLQKRDSGSQQDRFSRISGLLLRLGFSAKLRGYSYLRDAVLRFAEDPDQSIIKELYPGVAMLYGVSPEDVEHSIRSAAMDAWTHSRQENWALFFDMASEDECMRPSNAALIQRLANSLCSIRKDPAVRIL